MIPTTGSYDALIGVNLSFGTWWWVDTLLDGWLGSIWNEIVSTVVEAIETAVL